MGTKVISLTIIDTFGATDSHRKTSKLPFKAEADLDLTDTATIGWGYYPDYENGFGAKDNVNVYRTLSVTVVDTFGAADKKKQQADLVATIEDAATIKDCPCGIDNIGYVMEEADDIALTDVLTMEARPLLAQEDTVTFNDLVKIKPDYFICPKCGWTTRPKRPNRRPRIQPIGGRRYMIFGS